MTSAAATTAGMLHSDHINYLILRYLQESGHENAAEALYREWHRSSEYRDPELYPFAHAVRRRELVSIVQQGLVHDELRASVSKKARQFRFTTASTEDDVGHQVSREDSRPLSRGYKNGTTAMRAPDEFPMPAPKRQRRSEGSEGARMNGSMMDVDSKSNASADMEDDQEMISPAPASDTEEIIERYDSMEIGTQTEVKDVKTTTISWTIDKPGASVLCNLWNPDAASSRNALTLLTIGESLSRLHQLPNSLDGSEPLSHNDDEKIDANSSVTAAAWHPSGQSFVCAVDTLRLLPDGSPLQELTIIDHSTIKGDSLYPLGRRRLDPPGIVTRMRYSPEGDHLLVLQTNIEESLLSIWKMTTLVQDGRETFSEPCSWRAFDSVLVDAIWTQHSGLDKDVILTITTLGESAMVWYIPSNEDHRDEDATLQSHNLELIPREGAVLQGGGSRIAHDSSSQLLARVVHKDDRSQVRISLLASAPTEEMALSLVGDCADIAIRPSIDLKAGPLARTSQTLLAIAYQEGYCAIHSVPASRSHSEGVINGHDTASRLSQQQAQCWLPAGPALAIAFSPQGTYLAVANTDVVNIWAVDGLTRHAPDHGGMNGFSKPSTARVSPSAMVSWTRPTATRTLAVNGEVEDVPQPTLAWNADGQAIVLSVGNEVNVLRFRPALHHDAILSSAGPAVPITAATAQPPVINGH